MFPKRDVITLGTGGYLTGDLVNERFPSVNTYLQNFMDLPVLRPRLEGGRIVELGAAPRVRRRDPAAHEGRPDPQRARRAGS